MYLDIENKREAYISKNNDMGLSMFFIKIQKKVLNSVFCFYQTKTMFAEQKVLTFLYILHFWLYTKHLFDFLSFQLTLMHMPFIKETYNYLLFFTVVVCHFVI